MNLGKIINTTAVFSLCLSLMPSAWADLDTDILRLQKRWAEVNYQLGGKTQLTAFKTLISDADTVTRQHPAAAPAWIWSGIIKSTYAGAKGGLGALTFAKASKADLERALELDPEAMDGSAYTSLGTLYFNVPGWPIGFGDDDRAEELLLKAIAINPDGIDSNYFYGDYLSSEKRYREAEAHFLKAQSSPNRPNRPVADAGRQNEIKQALLEVREKLNK